MHGALGNSSRGTIAAAAACALFAGGCSSNNTSTDARVLDASDVAIDHAFLDTAPLGSDVEIGTDVVTGTDAAEGGDVVGMDVQAPTTVHVRFVNLVPNPHDALPPLDFCLRPAGMRPNRRSARCSR